MRYRLKATMGVQEMATMGEVLLVLLHIQFKSLNLDLAVNDPSKASTAITKICIIS